MSSTFMHKHSGKTVNIVGRVGKCVVNQYDINHIDSRVPRAVLFTQPGWKDTFSIPAEDFTDYFFMLKPIPGDILIKGGRLFVVEEVTPADDSCQIRACTSKLPFIYDMNLVSDEYEILTEGAELLITGGTCKEIKSMLPEIERINVVGYNNIPLSSIRIVTKYPLERIKKQEDFYETVRAQQNR